MTMRTPNNIRRSLRQALADSVLEGTTPHRMRATVATWIDRLEGLDKASEQLGHGNTDVTAAHYVDPVAQGPDVRLILDQLGPQPPVSDG